MANAASYGEEGYDPQPAPSSDINSMLKKYLAMQRMGGGMQAPQPAGYSIGSGLASGLGAGLGNVQGLMQMKKLMGSGNE